MSDPHAERGAAGPVWATTWTSGHALARLLAGRRLDGLRLLDLGCGLGLVAMAAAVVGAEVVASDRSRVALRFVAASAQTNGLRVEVVPCDWADPAPLERLGPWDLVVGADLLYDERSARRLLDLLARVVAPDGEVWLADPGRRASDGFLAAAWIDWTVATWRHGGVRLYRLEPRVR